MVFGDGYASAVVPNYERGRLPLRRDGLVVDYTIVAEGQDAEGHDLFGEVWMCPFVWLALREELERGSRVIHLVEIHVAGPVQPVAPRREDRERDERGHADVPTRRKPARAEPGGEDPRATTGLLGAREIPRGIAFEPGIAAHQP